MTIVSGLFGAISISALLVGLGGLLTFLTVTAIKTRARLALVDRRVLPLSVAFQESLVKELTHFHYPRMDALLTKLDPFSLSIDEELELFTLLEERARDMSDVAISQSEREAAIMLPMVVRRVRADLTLLEKEASATRLRFVAVPILPDV